MTIAVNLAVSAGVVVLLLGGVFALSVARDRHDLIDTAWGLGFALVAVTTFVLSTGDTLTRVLLTALTVVWGVRLAVHIGRRSIGAEEDHRYVAIRRKAGGHARMLPKVYLPQAAAMYVVSLPVQVGQYGTATHPALLVAGVVLWLVGFGFEAVGDAQLARFRADPAMKGRVLDTGLWRYTRHPNYFGDACVWWGLYLLALHGWWGLIVLVSPILMTFTLARGTGKPLLEGHLSRTRPGYADYVARTSGFFPLPPKKGPVAG